jgi:AraC-like DNA-binding protein
MGRIISEATDAFSTDLGLSYTRELEKSETAEFGCEQLIQLYIEQLLISLIRGHKRKAPVKAEENNKLLLQICGFLQENVGRHLCFDDIRKEFNLSASVIKRLFQNGMGCGVMEHFTRLKIDTAKQMIRENELNFTEIAETLGFNTPQYFTTVFRRISGMTPSEYESSVKSNFAEK